MKILCESCGALCEGRLVGRPGGAVLSCAACGAETAVAEEGPDPEATVRGPSPALPSGEEDAWAALAASWSDQGLHRAFLARFADLEGLARAGARYREVLATRPSDPAALRARDEILKRATALGLAVMPRTEPRRPLPPAVKWGAVALLVGALLGAAVWVVWTLAGLGTLG